LVVPCFPLWVLSRSEQFFILFSVRWRAALGLCGFGFGLVPRSSSSRRRPIFNSSRARSALQRLLVRCRFGSAPFLAHVPWEARAQWPDRRCLIWFRRLIFFTTRAETPFLSRPDLPMRQSAGPLALLKFFFSRQRLRPICFLVVGQSRVASSAAPVFLSRPAAGVPKRWFLLLRTWAQCHLVSRFAFSLVLTSFRCAHF
jgi:hypothetical protein